MTVHSSAFSWLNIDLLGLTQGNTHPRRSDACARLSHATSSPYDNVGMSTCVATEAPTAQCHVARLTATGHVAVDGQKIEYFLLSIQKLLESTQARNKPLFELTQRGVLDCHSASGGIEGEGDAVLNTGMVLRLWADYCCMIAFIRLPPRRGSRVARHLTETLRPTL